MAKVLSISSQVVYGHVGNSVTAFVLQSLGHEVRSLPTIILSNRPGYAALNGTRLSPETLNEMLEAGATNGWLNGVDTIVTGYLPSESHVKLCADWIVRLKALRPDTLYLCDPILGDEPGGVYIDEAAAHAVRDRLLPLADIATPNGFELGWLTQSKLTDTQSAMDAAKSLPTPAILVTSAPCHDPGKLANLLVERDQVVKTELARRIVHARGTGDFFASVFLGHKLNGASHAQALLVATSAMELVLDASEGQPELALVGSRTAWAKPWMAS